MAWGRAVITGLVCVLCVASAHATEPDDAAVACLTSILRSAPAYVSVEPVPDWRPEYNSDPRDYRPFVKGVAYTFRRPAGDVMMTRVYLFPSTHLVPDYDACHGDPYCIPGSYLQVANNDGRYAIWLREPYPPEWYPLAKWIDVPPNGRRPVRQDSPDHPLFKLWDRLASECHADNTNINSGVTP